MTKKGGTKVPPFFLSYIRVGVPSEFGSLTASGITYWDVVAVELVFGTNLLGWYYTLLKTLTYFIWICGLYCFTLYCQSNGNTLCIRKNKYNIN